MTLTDETTKYVHNYDIGETKTKRLKSETQTPRCETYRYFDLAKKSQT